MGGDLRTGPTARATAGRAANRMGQEPSLLSCDEIPSRSGSGMHATGFASPFPDEEPNRGRAKHRSEGGDDQFRQQGGVAADRSRTAWKPV